MLFSRHFLVHSSRLLSLLPTALFLSGEASLLAQQAPKEQVPNTPPATNRPNPEGKLEDLGLLVRDDKAPVLNELWVLGRYHGQYHWSDATDRDDQGYETRRFRLGGQARLFERLTLHAQAISGSDFEPRYNGFTELWASWRFTDALIFTVGQQKHRFTHDRNVSSRYLNYLERSQLTNMFAADYTPAVTLSGRASDWSYYGGVFSNATGTDMVAAFSELNSGYSLLGSLTYDMSERVGFDSAAVSVSGVHSDANRRATNLNYFEQGIAAAFLMTQGPVSLVNEVTTGLGNTRGDAIGWNLQPSVFCTDRLQLVGRYQLAVSDGDNGLRAQRRYERDVGLTTGDRYQAGYFGANYHLAGHRMKVMSGVEYSTLGGEGCWTFSIAFRVFWGPHARGTLPMGDTLPGYWSDD